jgi:hypothetical protein
MAGPSRLKPGGKSSITARIAPQLKNGVMVEKIEVSSNDPKRPKITLTVQARVVENILHLLQKGFPPP